MKWEVGTQYTVRVVYTLTNVCIDFRPFLPYNLTLFILFVEAQIERERESEALSSLPQPTIINIQNRQSSRVAVAAADTPTQLHRDRVSDSEYKYSSSISAVSLPSHLSLKLPLLEHRIINHSPKRNLDSISSSANDQFSSVLKMMNHCVPDFHEMDDDDSIPTPSGFSRHKRPTTGEEEIMELLWQNGQVVVQSQNQRPSKKSIFGGGSGEVVLPSEREIRSTAEEQQHHHQHHVFMQEDEMSSWLQYPLDDSSFDRDFYTDLLYPTPPPPSLTATPPQPRPPVEIRPPPPPPPPPAKPDNPPRVHNFVHFSRLPTRPRTEAVRESTVVESSDAPESRVSHVVADSRPPVNSESATAKTGGTSAAAGEVGGAGTCELTVSSSPGGSRSSFSEETRHPLKKPPTPTAADDRKRKAREADDAECQSEDIEFEAAEGKKQARGSASTKRSRAAEVHNLSERRRRDRINEKMKALQELIPRCNKSDKASMLDEAIEYLKSLQLQVQMMSMGCGMVPMMYPGMQQFMPAMGMGMGMGMGMDMGMNRPMVPYPSMLPGSAMPNPAAPMAPRYPLPPFHMPQVPVPDPSRPQATNPTESMPNPTIPQHLNQQRMPNFADPYQQYFAFHQAQQPLPQGQAVVQPDVNKPSTSKDIGNTDNHQSG